VAEAGTRTGGGPLAATVAFLWLINSERGDALNDPEHRQAADGVGRQKLDDGESFLVDGRES
jgi:hypothetical protein